MVEVIAMSTLLFLVLTELSPVVSILVLNGVFFVQPFIDICTSRKKCFSDNCNIRKSDTGTRSGYAQVEEKPLINEGQGPRGDKKCFMVFQSWLRCVLEHCVVKVVALLLQLGGLVGLIIFWAVKMHNMKPLISLPLVLISLSFVWSNRFQEAIARPDLKAKNVTESQEAITNSNHRDEKVDESREAIAKSNPKDNEVTARFKSSECTYFVTVEGGGLL